MHRFLRNNRLALIERCQQKLASRSERAATPDQLKYGVPLFLDQLAQTLEIEQTDDPLASRAISGPSGGGTALFEVGISAAHYGRQLSELGFSVDQVVHDYGDLCQSITDLAFERDAPFSVDEFRTLNRCLDNAISEAVSEFSFQRDAAVSAKRDAEEQERLGSFAHELRNALGTASLAFTAAKVGGLSMSGATGAVLERSIESLRILIDQSLMSARATPTVTVGKEQFSVAEFIAELQSAAELSAASYHCNLVVSRVEPELAIEADRELLLAAVGNLLQNGFKFTKPNTEVRLNAYASGDHILIDVKDHCGGLPAGTAEQMFLPFQQLGLNKTGLGLGLSIARRTVSLYGGALTVRDLPGEGCIFTILLPRHTTR
jgi:signal transduction histidine kinase